MSQVARLSALASDADTVSSSDLPEVLPMPEVGLVPSDCPQTCCFG